MVTESQPLILCFGPLLAQMTDHEFFVFCQLNPEGHMECTSTGDVIITPPTGGWTGTRHFTLMGILSRWVEADGTGLGFDASTGFVFPNGAKRSPDLAWVTRARWEALTAEEQEEFPPLCPDFVVALRSRSDDLATLQAKMQAYMANGAQLGWLIDPQEKKVYIYRPNAEVDCLENPMTISGEPLLSGFTLNLQQLWS
jgi:Uma2 family endonuclease